MSPKEVRILNPGSNLAVTKTSQGQERVTGYTLTSFNVIEPFAHHLAGWPQIELGLPGALVRPWYSGKIRSVGTSFT